MPVKVHRTIEGKDAGRRHHVGVTFAEMSSRKIPAPTKVKRRLFPLGDLKQAHNLDAEFSADELNMTPNMCGKESAPW